MTTFPMTIIQANKANICQTCNFAGRLPKQQKPCDYHRMLNYLHVPLGRCALTQADIDRRKQDYSFARGRFGKEIR